MKTFACIAILLGMGCYSGKSSLVDRTIGAVVEEGHRG